MLAIGRALMTNPKLLILDEATEGLAPVIRAEIWRCIEALKAQRPVDPADRQEPARAQAHRRPPLHHRKGPHGLVGDQRRPRPRMPKRCIAMSGSDASVASKSPVLECGRSGRGPARCADATSWQALVAAGCGPHPCHGDDLGGDRSAAFHPSRHDDRTRLSRGLRRLPARRSGASSDEAGPDASARAAAAGHSRRPTRRSSRATRCRNLGRAIQPAPAGRHEGAVPAVEPRRRALPRPRMAGSISPTAPAASRRSTSIVPTASSGAPIWVFVHGGYWQASDKVPARPVRAGDARGRLRRRHAELRARAGDVAAKIVERGRTDGLPGGGSRASASTRRACTSPVIPPARISRR